jgi:hypothetical protein
MVQRVLDRLEPVIGGMLRRAIQRCDFRGCISEDPVFKRGIVDGAMDEAGCTGARPMAREK